MPIAFYAFYIINFSHPLFTPAQWLSLLLLLAVVPVELVEVFRARGVRASTLWPDPRMRCTLLNVTLLELDMVFRKSA